MVPEDDPIEPRRGRGQVIRILGRLVESYAAMGAESHSAEDVASEEKPDDDALEVAVDRAAAFLRRGDEITILSDFGGSLGRLAAVARKLSGHRVLRAVVIEDAIYDQPVPAGRYPVRVSHDVIRSTAAVTRSGSARHNAAVEKIRVDLIEAGFPIASPGDFEAVKSVSELITESTVCGLARALDKDIDCAANALKPAKSFRIHTFLATSPIHMREKLRMEPEQVIENAVAEVEKDKIDLLTLLPNRLRQSFVDKLIYPFIDWSILCFLPVKLAHVWKNPYLSFTFGQFMLFRKSAYLQICLLYTSPSPRDATLSRMPASA